MEDLIRYVNEHSQRGACQCDECFEFVKITGDHTRTMALVKTADLPARQPTGHTADLIFFRVSAINGASADELRRLIMLNKHGAFCEVDIFDGGEHNYLEIGGWIGDQGLGLTFMGLGAILGLWKLMTPKSLLGSNISEEQCFEMAGRGMIVIQAKETAH